MRPTILGSSLPTPYFNPRTHVGCDLAAKVAEVKGIQFQSTHPRGVRQKKAAEKKAAEKFQSTHPRGVRPVAALQSLIDILFQSTHPRGVRHRRTDPNSWPCYFNPRTHVGCDLCTPTLMSKINISIHAPTWGATLMVLICSHFVKISIHAPTWGATYHKDCSVQCGEYFNPRTHVGCDAAANASDITKLKFQSTHPRGVRLRINPGRTRNINFNPRTHVGCDPAASGPRTTHADFNPRTHVGCDRSPA